ncbi:prepilin-type N-terminal cleavage/methylation domain-containing protein [Acidithiobacillus concretivorus]|uniref:Prepilin-type N-terminal cleavage/methylation domain-containing protein n=1 Tax=Acidithiobacillus concretivorus TaxID=3063952 RepID=A0ABS5ZSB7_9PROT|nr:prepilin-type N-terminal cleavage/methylation domain-containing protein [Acidithiobacillus concretivorus]MBU2739528.1 prepilin-type N-terminal cleavage/methylation domain-containing protein [Acidithiobacillus concretivorus]
MCLKKRYRNHQNGFTLIEMMITIAIIAILATISLPLYFQYLRFTQAEVVVANFRSAASVARLDIINAQTNKTSINVFAVLSSTVTAPLDHAVPAYTSQGGTTHCSQIGIDPAVITASTQKVTLNVGTGTGVCKDSNTTAAVGRALSQAGFNLGPNAASTYVITP